MADSTQYSIFHSFYRCLTAFSPAVSAGIPPRDDDKSTRMNSDKDAWRYIITFSPLAFKVTHTSIGLTQEVSFVHFEFSLFRWSHFQSGACQPPGNRRPSCKCTPQVRWRALSEGCTWQPPGHRGNITNPVEGGMQRNATRPESQAAPPDEFDLAERVPPPSHGIGR